MSLFQSISGFISSAIVGGGSGSGGAGLGGGGGSGDPSLSSAASTPLSDGVSAFFQPPMARSRNPSGASSAQHSPVVALVRPPSLDLSHLSEEERKQIEAVLARAREVQDGPGLSTSSGLGGFGPGPGAGGEAPYHRQRDLQDEGHAPLMSSVPVSSSAAVPPHPPHRPEPSPEREVSLHTCAVCAETRMTESDRNICVDCRRDICLNCGSSDEAMEWLCNICRKRREIVTATTRWKASQQTSTDQSASLQFFSTFSSTSFTSPASIFSSPACSSVTVKQDTHDRKREPPALLQGPRPYAMQSALSRQLSDPPQRISPSPPASSAAAAAAASQATKQAISFRRQTSLPYATHAEPPKVNQPPVSPDTPPSPPSPPPPPPPPPPQPPSIPSSFLTQSSMERTRWPDAADPKSSVSYSDDLNHFEEAMTQRSKVKQLTEYDELAEAEAMAGIYFEPEVDEMNRRPEEMAEETEVTCRRSRPHQLELSTTAGKEEEERQMEEGGGGGRHGGGAVRGGSREDDDAFASTTQMMKMGTSTERCGGGRRSSFDDSPTQDPHHHEKQQPQPIQRDSTSSSSSYSSSSSSSSASSASSSPPVSKGQEPAAANASGARTKGAKTPSPRSVAESAAAESGSKKKPSALDRVSLAGHHDYDRNQSPSRRSPKSPPRSPSWMRYRESPPRSPPFRSLSPSISPTERFPSSLGDPQRSEDPQGAYVEEYEISLDGNDTAFVFDTLGPAEGNSNAESLSSLYHVPQKPTRLLMDPLGCAGLLQPSAAESTSPLGRDTLASFAASIASDTALLTSLSVSPMVEVQRDTVFGFGGGGGSEGYEADRQRIIGQGVALVAELTDPTPKTIDFQNSKRQKIKPPTASTDWSPVSDLSPILDVSPSIERVEQEMMTTTLDDERQQQQQFRCSETGSEGWHDEATDAGGRRILPTAPLNLSQNQQQQQSVEDAGGRQSALKRAPRFEDIRSVAGKVAEHDEVQDVNSGQSEVKRGQCEVNRGHGEISRGQCEVNRGQGEVNRGPGEVSRGQCEVYRGQGEVNRDQGDVNRGQCEVNRGQNETSWNESGINRGQVNVNRGQIEGNRDRIGQIAVKRGQSEINKGHNEDNRSQSVVNWAQSRVSEEAGLQSRAPMNKEHIGCTQEQSSSGTEKARQIREQATREQPEMTKQHAGTTRVQHHTEAVKQQTGMTREQKEVAQSQMTKPREQVESTKQHTGMTKEQQVMTKQVPGVTKPHTGMTSEQMDMTREHVGMTKPQTGVTKKQTGVTKEQTGIAIQRTGSVREQVARINRGEIGSTTQENPPEITSSHGITAQVIRGTRDSTAKHQVGVAADGAQDRDDAIRGNDSLNRERFLKETITPGTADAQRAAFEHEMATPEVVSKDPGLRSRQPPVHRVSSGRTTAARSRTPDGASDSDPATSDAHVRTATPRRPEVDQSGLRSGAADAPFGTAADRDSDAIRVRRHLPPAISAAATVKSKQEEPTHNQMAFVTPSASATTTTSSISSSFQTSPVVASGDAAADRMLTYEPELVGCHDRKLCYDPEGLSALRGNSISTRSPGSPVDLNRKPRRRLPSLPPEAETDSSPQQLRRVRSRSADSRAEERNPEKERLRRCLRMREIERRRSFDRDDDISITAGQQQQHRSRTGSWNGEDLRPRTIGRKSRVDSMSPGSRRSQTGTSGGGGSYQRSWLTGNYVDPSSGGSCGDVKNSYAERSNDAARGKMYASGGNGGARSETKPKPKWNNSKSKRVEMVTIRGVQVPVDVKSLKQRIREELQIVTASQRLRLDEEEEVRRMEAEMANREKQRRLKAEKEAVEEAAKKEADRTKKKREQTDRDQQQRLHATTIDSEKSKLLTSGRVTSTAAPPVVAAAHHGTVPRLSPHASPHRARHRRQNSDPMIAKFSPIEEDRDIEAELHYQRQQLSSEARRLAASIANYTSPIPVRRNRKYTAGLSHPTAFEETLKRYYHTPVYGSLSRSSDLLAKLSLLDKEARMSSSQSESCLPMTSRSKTPTYYSDDDDVKNKEEKKLLLQMEIGLRKRQLEETKMLQKEIQRLVEMPDISPFEMEKARLLYQQHLRSRDNISASSSSAGIIRPIDHHQGKMTDAAQRRRAKEAGSRIPVSASGASTLGSRHPPPVRQSSSSDSSDYITHRPTTSDVMLTKTKVPDNSRQTDISSHVIRSTSEHSLADSDEYIMEGGVTIRRRKKAKAQPKSELDSQPLRQYDFPTKRILLTRDPKDKSLQGNGIGVKIVGGKIMPERDGEIGAFVTAIFRGGVADQLHGVLHEGDQVLEWNGVTLSGKTFEEVQQIMSQPNGEIELVIRTTESSISSKPSSSVSTIQTDSRRSSYDNLEAQSDYDDYGHSKVRRSPGVSPSSSQHDLQTGSSMSTSGSSDPTDILSSTREPEHPTSNAVADKSTKKQGKDLGEVQLQLSYDTYDGTLNVHVIQARRLQPKDTNGFSDPYVKLYLLPSRSSENKRRTRYISKTLDPEWHQTFVFMGIPRNEMPLKTLEVSVWDYDRFKPNDFLGQVILNLSETSYLDNRPHWYPLQKLNAAQPLVARGRFDSFSHPGSDQTGGNGGPGGPGGSSRVSPSGRGASTGAEGQRSSSTTGGGGGAGPGSLPRRRSSSPRERNRNSGNSHRTTIKADRSGNEVGAGRERIEKNRRAVPPHNHHGSRAAGGGVELPRQFSNGSTLSTKSDLSDRFSPIQIRPPKMATHHEEKFFTKILRGTLHTLVKSLFCCQRRLAARFQNSVGKEQITHR